MVLDEGRVVGTGTHDELMDDCEVYREIVLSQLSPEEAPHERHGAPPEMGMRRRSATNFRATFARVFRRLLLRPHAGDVGWRPRSALIGVDPRR